jgi:hypothetical protein
MNGQDVPQASPRASPGHQYQDVSVVALGVMLLVLLHWGMGRWSFIPVLIGLLGMTLRWQITPLLTLIVLAGLLLGGELTEQSLFLHSLSRGFSLPDWFLCGAVLAFCAAQCRIQGMTRSIMPMDRNRRRQDLSNRPMGRLPRGVKEDRQRRSPRLVSPSEIGWLVLLLPICAFLAQLCWGRLPASGVAYGLSSWTWRGIVLAWLLVLGVLVVAGLLSYAGQRRLREREARLYLQDTFWQVTGSEQRHLNRWLTWAKLRIRKRGQSP